MYQHLQFELPQFIQFGYLRKVKKHCNENNINKALYLNRTPMHIAVICGQVKILQYLLTLKYDLNLQDELHLNICDWVQKVGIKPIKTLMMMHIPQIIIKQKQWQEEELDIYRCAEISPELLKKKIKKQNPFIKDKFKRNALHWAALSGNVQSWYILIECKLNPLSEDQFGFNCIHYIQRNQNNPLLLQLSLKANLDHELLPNNCQSYEVIIIGAGASGIGAGITLSRKGISYIVLQARDRICGRVYGQSLDGVEMDWGACWVHSYSKNNPIKKQITRMNWPSRKATGRCEVQYKDQQNVDISNKILNHAIHQKNQYFRHLQLKASKVNQDLSLQQAGKIYYQKQIAHLQPEKKRVVNMFINMTQHYQAASIEQLSAKHYDQTQCCGGDFSPSKSYYTLLKQIAYQENLKVKFQQIVQQINYSNEVEVICRNGIKYKGKKVIVSLPLGILKKKIVKFSPQLPKYAQSIINRLGFGLMNKILMSFEKPFWNPNASWIRIACNEKGKFPFLYNFSKLDKYILCCFITDNYAKKISSFSDKQIIENIIELFIKVYPKQIIKLKQYKITRWNQQQFSMGSYSHFAINSCSKDTKLLRKSIENLLWIVGQHCYGQHIGTAHGAFQTGVWAAQQIAHFIKFGQEKKQIQINKKKK